MGPASRRLRGVGRQGVIAGGFALLALALAPVLPAALGDRHHAPGGHGPVRPAVPVQAPPLAQHPAAPGPQAGRARARHGRHRSPAAPARDPVTPSSAPVAPAPSAPIARDPPAPAAAQPAHGQGHVYGRRHGRAAPRLLLPASGGVSAAPAPVTPAEPGAGSRGTRANILGVPGAAKKAPAVAAPAPATTPAPPVAALALPDATPATPAPAVTPAGTPRAAPTTLTVRPQPLTSGALFAKRPSRRRAGSRAVIPATRAGATRAVAATTAPAAVSPAAASTTTRPRASAFAGPSPDVPTAQDRTRVGFVPVVIDALSSSVAFVPMAVWVGLAALAALALLLAGVALARHSHARRLGRERAGLIADIEALEGALLPALPRALGGLALSASSTPALAGGVGGDFHDAFALSGDRVAVVVGDAAGQGGQALADGQLVRHAVRAYLEAGLDPRAALAMTGAVVDEREEPLFASVLIAVHDRKDGTLKIASAGHEPPILVGPHGAGLPPVGGWSPPLGTGLETGRRQTSIPLAQGSAVCLVTDGVTEARGEGERIGVSRVIKWLSALGPQATAADVAARLHEETDTTGDDVTVCMLRAITPADPAAPRVEEAIVEGGDPTYLVRFLRDCGLPVADAEEAGEALAAAPDGTRMIASVEIHGGRAVVELAPLRGPAPSQLIR